MIATRRLVIILGDQLDLKGAALRELDPERDLVWMAELVGEASHVPSHKQRIALFLAAMRHFRDELTKRGVRVDYRALDGPENTGALDSELSAAITRHAPEEVHVTEPGEWRVRELIEATCRERGARLVVHRDDHFLASVAEFRAHAEGRKQLRMEYFYREMRRRHGVLMDDGEPAGGRWNFDKENRKSFGKTGPGRVPARHHVRPDRITREVLELVERRFPKHPGSLASFAWPVTRRAALASLRRFIRERLARFGDHQDAMWTGAPFLYHSHLAAALNLKLPRPREVIDAAERAYRDGSAPLPAVEGFVRQILGWREYVRGVYWLHMPGYLQRNALAAEEALPEFYWTGETPMTCLRETIGQTLEYGYAHHIQRLMITGLYALLLGVDPAAVHAWYLAVYVDAVEWVELPNTLGMSQYADGGVMASKPYCASGKYIDRMSNYCRGCAFNPRESTGPRACPFTTLYWDFLLRNRERLASNQRMSLQLRNLSRLDADARARITARARALRDDPAARALTPA